MTMQPSSVIYYPGYAQTQVQPNLRWQVITAITQSYPMVVTTEFNHGYPEGVIVNFLIPSNFGMIQLNGRSGQILAVTDDTMTIDMDSSAFYPFVIPSPLPQAYTPPTVYANASGPYLPPKPLPYGNQDSFEGVIYNDGET